MTKSTIFSLILLCATSPSLLVQEEPTNNEAPQEAKLSGTLFWGLFTWGDYNKVEVRERVDNESIKVDKPISVSIDTTRYEVKSILGGAVQWSERKSEPTEPRLDNK